MRFRLYQKLPTIGVSRRHKEYIPLKRRETSSFLDMYMYSRSYMYVTANFSNEHGSHGHASPSSEFLKACLRRDVGGRADDAVLFSANKKKVSLARFQSYTREKIKKFIPEYPRHRDLSRWSLHESMRQRAAAGSRRAQPEPMGLERESGLPVQHL